MPIKLKGVLAQIGIKQAAWAASIRTQGGRTRDSLSLSAATQIINWGTWPKLTPREDIQRQTEQLLRDRGVTEEVIATIWEEDVEDQFRAAHPPHEKKLVEPDIEPLEAEMLSANAKKLFQLFRDPFIDDVAGPEDVFLSPDQRYIREAMFTTAKHGGFLAVIGESGAGKTVLRHDLEDRIQRDGLPIILIQPRQIDKAKLTAGGIYEAIVDDIRPGEKVKRSPEGRTRQVEQLLTASSRAGNSHALLIEEAHDLAIPTLKHLKRFWEMADGFKKLLSVILVGQPELKNKLDMRQHYEAREVIQRCEIAELMPLDRHLEEYLALKFKRVGKSVQELFDPTAFDALRARMSHQKHANARISVAYPLAVNNLITKAMNVCAEIGETRITADLVRQL